MPFIPHDRTTLRELGKRIAKAMTPSADSESSGEGIVYENAVEKPAGGMSMIRWLSVAGGLALLWTEVAGAAKQPYPLRKAVECTRRNGLPNFFAKLEAGKRVRIAYLGGSITAQPGWRPKTLNWFRKQYPQATIDEINAAIGGTGSELGVFRLHHDVLRFKPDLLFVEFAVNDGGTSPERIHRSMEGIVRQTWKAVPTTDICYVYTLTMGMLKDLQSGRYPRAASAMEAVADHYGIPSIHLGVEVARLEREGKLVFKAPKPATPEQKAVLAGKVVFSPDGVHPYPDTGHEIYLKVIARCMDRIKGIGKPGPHTLNAPLVAGNWEGAKMVPLDRATLSTAWQKLDPATVSLARRFAERLPGLWKVDKPGESLSFRFKGTYAAVYDLLGPDCGQVVVTLDDHKPVVRRRIDGYCTYHRLATLPIGTGLPDAVHTVRIELSPGRPDKRSILFDRNKPDYDNHPDKYADSAWYAGALLLNGDLVP